MKNLKSNNGQVPTSGSSVTIKKVDRQYGIDELNLAELPIALLDDTTKSSRRTDQRRQRQDKREEAKDHIQNQTARRKSMPRKREIVPGSFEIHDWVTDPLTKERQTRTWIVTGSEKYGLPIASDDEVVIGLLQITKRKDTSFLSREISITRYELCREMGWGIDHHNYDRIKEAFDRLVGVTIYTDKFWDARGKKYVPASFHILDNYYLYDQRWVHRKQQLTLDLSRILWNEILLQSFQRGGLKYLDVTLWRSWKKPITRRLHRYLDKHRHWKAEWRIDLFDLGALLNIPPSQRRYPKDIKKYVDRALKEMLPNGYLSSAFYTRNGLKQEAVFRFTDSPAQPKKPQSYRGDQASEAPEAQAEELVHRFYKLFHDREEPSPGIKELQQARKLISQHGGEFGDFILDFIRAEAPNYRPQFFGGIQPYVNRAVARFEERRISREAQAAIDRCTLCNKAGMISFQTSQNTWLSLRCPHDIDKIEAYEKRENVKRD